jgi:hypothetical protein
MRVGQLCLYKKYAFVTKYLPSAHHLHSAVDNLGFSARFQHTENPKKAVLCQNGLFT